MRTIGKCVLLALGLIAVMMYHSPEAQITGSTQLAYETETPPGNTSLPWIRNLDKQTFEYSDSLGNWVGQPYVVWGSKNATGVFGELKFGQACEYDTTSAAPVGWYLPERMQLMRASWSASNVGSVTDSTVIHFRGTMDTLWNLGSWADGCVVTPSGAIADSGAIVIVDIKRKAASPTDPDYPNVWLEFRPVVAP